MQLLTCLFIAPLPLFENVLRSGNKSKHIPTESEWTFQLRKQVYF